MSAGGRILACMRSCGCLRHRTDEEAEGEQRRHARRRRTATATGTESGRHIEDRGTLGPVWPAPDASKQISLLCGAALPRP